jgi:hypothetical protein
MAKMPSSPINISRIATTQASLEFLLTLQGGFVGAHMSPAPDQGRSESPVAYQRVEGIRDLSRYIMPAISCFQFIEFETRGISIKCL